MWQKVVGQTPQRVNTDRGSGLLVESGDLSDRVVCEFHSTLNRFDIIVARSPDPADPLDFQPTFDSAKDAMAVVEPLAFAWLETCNFNVMRLAWGSQLTIEAQDQPSAFAAVVEQVPNLALRVPKASDLAFQVNLPKESAVIHGMRINRITKWNNLQARIWHQAIAQTKFYALVETDFSTDATRTIPIGTGTRGVAGEVLAELKGFVEYGFGHLVETAQ